MDGQGVGKIETVKEAPQGLRMERLTSEDFFKYQGLITEFGFDATNASESPELKLERRKELAKLYAQSLEAGQHVSLFLLKDAERVIGLVALRVDPGRRHGFVEKVWLPTLHHQASTFRQVLESSETELRNRGCEHATVKAEAAAPMFEHIAGMGELGAFFTFEKKEDDAVSSLDASA